MNHYSPASLLMIALVCPLQAAEYYAATGGNDDNPGTREKPFRHIQKCADAMSAGDTCLVRGGVYRETVHPKKGGGAGQPVRFVAWPGEVVTLSGTEPVAAKWAPYRGSIYRAKVERDFKQLFAGGQMMIEARWPDMRFDQLWDRSRWASAGAGSRYGKIVDPELAKTGIDWTGALATLNVAHQFLTWTRPVAKHAKDSGTFEYSRDLPTITSYADKTKEWEDDRYYLSGKLEALDSPAEWFLDTTAHTLYLWSADGATPARHKLEVKARDYAFEVDGLDYIEISGFHFFGATFRFENSSHSVVDRCHLLFPTYARELTDLGADPKPTPATRMSGSYNTIRNSSLAYSSTGGFSMSGPANVIENSLVREVCWSGSLRYVGIDMKAGAKGGSPSVVRGNTVLNSGNASINFRDQVYRIEYNHAYNGGLACKDVALIYTGMPQIAGSTVRYNWAHGCHTEEGHGLGIRGDDQTRSLTVDHNVVWDTGRDGIIVKGDHNKVYSNTVLEIGDKGRKGNYISLHTESEPVKPWREQFPLLQRQNANSLVFNNVAMTITGDRTLKPFPEGENVSHNFMGADPRLRDPKRLDFRPRDGSPLIDAGRAAAGLTDDFQGKAPDIGAYEYGGKNWQPGYQNTLWVSSTAVRSGERLSIALAMPPLEPIQVTIVPQGETTVSQASLVFTTGDWMQARTVTVTSGKPGTLRIEAPGLESIRIATRP